ncbi:MAG: ABC transporter ATP-binding protein [Alphaproteobacteria bacterium]|nr:ABC transporter ATP-binding protein [Alphaproteobacteria bacterium]
MLALESLSCGHGAITAVHGLSLAVEAGRIAALVGPNGAGKSSTLMCIAGHVRATAGRVVMDGSPLDHLPPHERVRRGIAIAPEGRRLFKTLSVEDNLRVGGMIHPAREFARDRDRVLALFPRLRERIASLAGTLSGGEQQMLAIGRALMARPRLLLIDELSLGLMPKVIDACYEALGRLRDEGLAILLVEQNTERVMSVADTITVLESGETVWRGTADAARRDPSLLDAYLGTAAGPAAEEPPPPR